ncbi:MULTISPECIES: hypothetical protein [Nocardia]|uniref:hypothetical protein n=1 Tax=Nocardia TaxID=1817 RepID=UPI000D693916|nr:MULTISPECIES: hypothetical protein [Nocardia]
MRTYFEPDEIETYETAKDLLIRRCVRWAAERRTPVDPFALAAALDFRHESIDGRLGYWTAALAEEFLLSFAPRTLSTDARAAAGLPDSLRHLIEYLDLTALLDPTGDPQGDLDAAITRSVPAFAAAMADQSNFGVAKFWVMTAIGHGVDPTDSSAMSGFFDDVDAGRIDHDDEILAQIIARHERQGGGRVVRAVAQLPVSLPARPELDAVAEQTPIVTRLRALISWVGDGRVLTTTGNLRLADARELVTLLDTGDTIDPKIGDRVFRTKSSAELPGLARLVELAKKIRLVRVVKNRLVRVAKASPLLRYGSALWTAAFDAQPELGLPSRSTPWVAEHTRMLDSVLGDVLPDVLNTVYGLPVPIPVIRLTESVWSACAATYYLDDLDPATATRWREGVSSNTRRLFDELAELGAVELTVGHPDPMYRSDLDIDDPMSLPPDARERLRAALDTVAGEVELIALTPLATQAVRARLLREGRSAPLVGELFDTEPAQLLGMVAEYYSEETTHAEITGWLAAHGGPEHGLPLLLDGIRDCPFRTRAAAMLDVLAQTMPDRSAFLHGLRADPHLGPTVVQLLIADNEITPDELDAEEGLRAMAEQFIHLMEAAGPEAVTGTLADLPTAQARDIVAALRDSGHPDDTGLEELLAVTEAHITERNPERASPTALKRNSSSRAKRGKHR